MPLVQIKTASWPALMLKPGRRQMVYGRRCYCHRLPRPGYQTKAAHQSVVSQF